MLATSSENAKTSLYTNDISGVVKRTGLVHLRCPCSNSAANTLPANCARPALRIFAGASTLHSAFPLRLAFQPLTGCARCCLQEAPGALKPSFLHLSPLTLTLRRAFYPGSIFILWCSLTSFIQYHQLYQPQPSPRPSPRPSRLLANYQPHRCYQPFSRVCRMLHCLLDC